MNDLLLSEINAEEIDLLQAVALIEEFIFGEPVDALEYAKQLSDYCQSTVSSLTDELDKAEQLINELYVHQLFIDIHRQIWPVVSHQLSHALSYRMLAPMLKCMLLKHIISHCGFDTDIVFVPEKVMLRIICQNDYAIIFDPVTGESLTWHDLDQRLDELSGDPSQQQVEVIADRDVVYKYISSMKNALIAEQQFDHALKCIDILLAMRPDDPFERRDRGFLLHQLDCFKVAYDDYRYFIEQCPQDPAAQLLKIQLNNIKIANTVLH